MRNKRRLRLTALLLVFCIGVSACATGATSVSDTSVSDANETSVSVPEEEKEPVHIITFDTDGTHQTIDGFGAAYTWYGEILLNANNSAEGLDSLFSDAKMTILRFKNEYEYTIPGKASNAVAMARNYKEARERAALYGEEVKTLLCCWSPPAYLKSDGTTDNGYGTIKKDENGNYMYKEYADWWVESVKYYSARGIKFDYVSIQNEIDFSPESYEGCRFGVKETETQASYAKAFLAVYDAFKEAFGDDAPILLGPETMGCEPSSMVGYTTEILKENPEALGGLAFHLYASGTSNEDENTVSAYSYMNAFSSMKFYFPDTKKWQTEFFIGRGIQTAELIWYALTTADLNAYIYWSGVWAEGSKDFESQHLVEVNSKGDWRLSANYYSLRHYSEFIRPGYVRVDADCKTAKVRVSAFKNENASKLALVLVNVEDKDIEVSLSGTDYTITEANVYQSVFGDKCQSEDSMYKNLGTINGEDSIVLPAKSVTTLDVTGYRGDTPVEVPVKSVITYDTDVNTDITADPIPEKDVKMLSCDFSTDSQVTSFTGFGSSICRRVADGGKDGTGCMIIKSRAQDWNGASLSSGYFEHYGYMAKISYDVMMLTDGNTVSCTSTFGVGKGTSFYPDGENNRVAVKDMKAGQWYHAEGYVTLYDNMEPGSFSVYWESPGNTDDIYIDNVELTILYTQPAGSYEN